ncbi:oxidoreductase [Desulfotomaculum sp. 1211_IL3151]|uniref:oxidoreductase n=1 Tax=Desulfotomaculum sp. 1211_IL3151 TaxID=3084055 RepID=UPI002FDAF187
MFENVLKKGKIGSLELKNRFIMPAMGSSHGDDGKVSQKLVDYYVARARGGFGLLTTEFAYIDLEGKAIPGQLRIDSDDIIPGLKTLTDAIHRAGGKVLVQLQHSGRQTNRAVTGMQPVAPSAVPCPVNLELPRELSIEEIDAVVEKFGDAALRAKKAGFDGVEIHGAHGYLVAQFLSGYTNKRVDEFGADLAGRMKFALELIKNIKSKCGKEFPLVFRISGEERVNGGLKLNETIPISKALAEAGADAIHVSTGVYASMPWMVAPASVTTGFNLYAAEAIKKAVNVPVIAVGRITDTLMAEEVIASGRADFVSLGRGSIADPEFPNKVAENRPQEISPCVGCMTRCQGVPGVIPGDRGVSCMINPFSGHEGTMKITPAKNPKTIVVVGGGPGGLEAAWVAAARGHRVTLLEKNNKVGGQFIPAAVPPGKQDLAKGIRYYYEMCKKYGVNLKLNIEADAEMILNLNPDEVILATGAVPLDFPIPNEGIEVVQAVDVLLGRVMLGKNVLIVGGGLVGLETAEHLLSQSRRVTIVEMEDAVGKNVHPSIVYFSLQSLKSGGAAIVTRTKVEKFKQDGALCTNSSGTIELSDFDMAVLAIGAKSYNPLERQLTGKVRSLHVIGDAAKVRRGVEAIDEGARLALKL